MEKQKYYEELRKINPEVYTKIRKTVIFESEKAIIYFDQFNYDNGYYYYQVIEKKDNTLNFRSFSTNNLVTALKRYRKYNS